MPSQEVWNNPVDAAVHTTSNGCPIAEPYAAQRVGPIGPLLLQDFHHIDLLAHFAHERIPERVVHAKGAGAHGYFETTHDLSDVTSCRLFTNVGSKVHTTVRFSTVGGEAGSSDTVRDVRGFSIKLRTDEGNLDWVFNNTPVSFMRDPAKFPAMIHSLKRDPQTHLKDADMFWDYFSQNPESIHQIMITFSDRGIPDGYHNMHGYSGNTYKLAKDDGTFVYVQLHLIADGGFRTLSPDTADKLPPDYGIKSLFEAIEDEKFPSWTVYVQTMTPQQAESFRYNVLDLTKVWPHGEYPLRPVGRLVLNKNVQNYFSEIEQIAFSPSHTIPYFEPSADPILQARLFTYPETHRHRIGINYKQLSVNRPIVPVSNFQRDGPMAVDNQGRRANYQSSISQLTYVKNKGSDTALRDIRHEVWIGSAYLDLSEVTELDFEQPRALYQNVMKEADRNHLVSNLVGNIRQVKSDIIKARILSCFASVDQSLSNRIANGINFPYQKPLNVKPASQGGRAVPSPTSKPQKPGPRPPLFDGTNDSPQPNISGGPFSPAFGLPKDPAASIQVGATAKIDPASLVSHLSKIPVPGAAGASTLPDVAQIHKTVFDALNGIPGFGDPLPGFPPQADRAKKPARWPTQF